MAEAASQFDLKLVDRSIEVPEIARKAGVYRRVLSEALKLKPTSPDKGLKPHYQWPCKSARELRTRMQTLTQTKKRNSEFAPVKFIQRTNAEHNEYVIYIWREGGKSAVAA